VTTADKFAINAVIDRLIESQGHDAEARSALYAFAKEQLPPTPRMSLGMETKTPGDGFTGHTSHGDVQITDEKEQVKTYELGVRRERIGSYRISRQSPLRGRWKIIIEHFWKAELGTNSEVEEPPTWCVECDDSGPLWVGEQGSRTVWTIGLHVQRRDYLERWGPHPGKLHLAGWSVGAEV
jgi:hypothetical protein